MASENIFKDHDFCDYTARSTQEPLESIVQAHFEEAENDYMLTATPTL
jgi:hypothetical protein